MQPIQNELKNYLILDEQETFIRFAGLLKLGYEKGIKEFKNELIQMPKAENDYVAVVKTTIVTRANEIFENYGTASPRNTREDFTEYLIEVATTRSCARALRLLTGIGFTCLEELPRDRQKKILGTLKEDIETIPKNKPNEVIPLYSDNDKRVNTLNKDTFEKQEANPLANIDFDKKEEKTKNKDNEEINKKTNENITDDKKDNKEKNKEDNGKKDTKENTENNEVVPLVNNQKGDKIKPEQVNYIRNLANIIAINTKRKAGEVINSILRGFNIKRLEDLEQEKVTDLINLLKENADM